MLPYSSPLPGEAIEEQNLHDLLVQCAANLTDKSKRGELPPAFGREQEVDQILMALASPLKGRIVVTGGARVGKTAIIQEVGARICTGKCPEALKQSELWALSARSILRAFGVQGWQEKLGRLMEKWAEHPEVILYVDALPTTLAAGATASEPFDMAQFLLGQLQSSSNRILAEGRTLAVHNFLEAYPEYKHVLMELKIPQPPLEIARDIVIRACEGLEASHGLAIEQDAINTAIDLTWRFALHERLPGKAIDLIAEGLALQSEKGATDSGITRTDIVARFGEKTGLPKMLLTDTEPYEEQIVRRYFMDRVLGQEQAVDVVVQALSLLRTRLNNPDRPMGVMLFIGPTGVGKTELARALAQFLFGGDEHLVRFNMADYTQDWDLHTLFGNPHGFDQESRRGQFTTRLQDDAFAVILLDEFEKAHPQVFQRFLQLFDEGILLNGASEQVNLRNSIVILTSNFGMRLLAAGRLGFGPAISLEDREEHIHGELVDFFTPEFINRVDNVCFFKPLTKPILREIAYRRVQEILRREGIQRRGLDVEVEEDVIEWVVEHGFSEQYGARYLARQIEKTITYPLAQQLIRNVPPPGALLRLLVRNDRIASALVLPSTRHVSEESVPGSIPTDARQLPRRMSADYIEAGLPVLTARIESVESANSTTAARTALSDLLQAMSMPSFWDEKDKLEARLDDLGRLSTVVDLVDGLRRNLSELQNFVREMQGGRHTELLSEAAMRYRYLVNELPRAEMTLQFTGSYDTCGAYLRIEAQGRRQIAYRWIADLAHMYLRWARRRDFQAQVLSEELAGAGTVRGLWIAVEGFGAYGLLRGEAGLHRLVDSVGNKGARHQMAHATITVYPQLPPAMLPELDRDMPTTTARKINRAGVLSRRLISEVHVEWGEAQQSLSLTGQMAENDLLERAVNILRIIGVLNKRQDQPPARPDGGVLVRSYVRRKQPYVHDSRTGIKSGKYKAILDGELDFLLEGYLQHLATDAGDSQHEPTQRGQE